MGTTKFAKAKYGFAGNEWRSSTTVESSSGWSVQYHKQHQSKCCCEPEGASAAEIATIGFAIQQQDPGTHSSFDFTGLEHPLPEVDHNILHRHNLHNLGHPHLNRQNPTNRPRQRSLRRPLLRRLRRRLRLLWSRRQRSNVRLAKSRTLHNHLRTR